MHVFLNPDQLNTVFMAIIANNRLCDVCLFLATLSHIHELLLIKVDYHIQRIQLSHNFVLVSLVIQNKHFRLEVSYSNELRSTLK